MEKQILGKAKRNIKPNEAIGSIYEYPAFQIFVPKKDVLDGDPVFLDNFEKILRPWNSQGINWANFIKSGKLETIDFSGVNVTYYSFPLGTEDTIEIFITDKINEVHCNTGQKPSQIWFRRDVFDCLSSIWKQRYSSHSQKKRKSGRVPHGLYQGIPFASDDAIDHKKPHSKIYH